MMYKCIFLFRSLTDDIFYNKGDIINELHYKELKEYEQENFMLLTESCEKFKNEIVKYVEPTVYKIDTIPKALYALFGNDDTKIKKGVNVEIEMHLTYWYDGMWY